MNLNFYKGDSILDIIIKRLKQNFPDLPIILATTTGNLDDALVERVAKHQISIFRGDEENVLSRFLGASEFYNITKLIRVCADNPFLDMKALKELVLNSKDSPFDYISFQTSEGVPTIKTHYGFWAEAVRVNALKKIKKQTINKYYLEHVTNFIYEHPTDFKLKFLPIQDYLNNVNIRLTIDTETDFNIARELYNEIAIDNKHDFTIKEIFNKVSERKDWLKIMSSEIKKQKK